jgi:hydrogenase maturation protease
MQDVLVLGLGNTLLCDDGVGVHVVRQLAADPAMPSTLRPLDGGTLGFRLLAALTASDYVLLVDAAQLEQPAGTIRLIDQQTLIDHLKCRGRVSAHEAGLVDLLTLARLDGWAPTRLALLGIQPGLIEWGDRLSDCVARSLPHACHTAIQTVKSWQRAV